MKRSRRDGSGVKNVLSMRGNYFKKEPARVEKVDRNGPCPCGSGLKFKRCCAQGAPGFLKRLWHSVFGSKGRSGKPEAGA